MRKSLKWNEHDEEYWSNIGLPAHALRAAQLIASMIQGCTDLRQLTLAEQVSQNFAERVSHGLQPDKFQLLVNIYRNQLTNAEIRLKNIPAYPLELP